MNTLERLKLELANKAYFTDDEYNVFLEENNLSGTDTYVKDIMQKPLLLTALDILEAVSNDVDIMRKVETEFTTVSDAYKFLEKRIQKLKDKIATISDTEQEYSPFSLMYTRK